MVKAQRWLDLHCPKKDRWSIEYLDFSNQNLVGDLDLTDFRSLKEINITGSPNLGRLINRPEATVIRIETQNWINWKYPQRQTVKEIKFEEENWEKVEGELIINDFPQLERIELWGGNIAELRVVDCPKLKIIDCWNNQLVELNVQNCPGLKILSCSCNFLDKLDLSQNTELEELNIMDNNFAEQDLSFLSHLMNLSKLEVGNGNDFLRDNIDNYEERIRRGIYNCFVGSLEPLKNMNKLKELDISNTDIDSGIEYLPASVSHVSCFTQERPRSKVKEIAWQLDLFTSGVRDRWKDLGFTLEEVRLWMDIGLEVNDYDFANYLKKLRLSLQEISSRLGELRGKYDELGWKDIHPDFTFELLEEWENRNFAYEQVKEWVAYDLVKNKSGLLSPHESELAEYLRSKKITPEEAKWYSNELREEYNNLGKSFPADEGNEVTEIGNWENIHPDFKYYQKKWEELGFDYQQTKKWIDRKLEPADFDLAYYLKKQGWQPFQLLLSDLIGLEKGYYRLNSQDWLEFWYPPEKRKEITKLNFDRKDLEGDLTIKGWRNLEEIECSSSEFWTNNFPKITLRDLPKLKFFIAQACRSHKMIINNCSNLQEINVSANSLTDLDFLDSLDPEKLTSLVVDNNNFPARDLTFFNKFKNLKTFSLRNQNFYGNLESLKNLARLEYLDISGTNVDRGLENLPEGLKIVRCDDERSQELGETTACSKIIKELRNYYLSEEKGEYNFQSWKKNQSAFKLVAENLSKINPNLGLQEFLRQQNVFLNVATGTFQGNLQGLAELLQINKSLFKEKERENILSELRIQELINLVQKQKEKIFNAYLNFPSQEKEKLGQLILVYLQLTKVKRQGLSPSTFEKQYQEIVKEQLSKKPSQKIIKMTQQILNDCKKLINWELELRKKLDNKLLVQKRRNQPLLLTDSSHKRKRKESLSYLKENTKQRKMVDAIAMDIDLEAKQKKIPLELVPNTPLRLLGKKSKFIENYNVREVNYSKIFLETSSSWKDKLPMSKELLPTKLYNIKTGKVEATEERTDIKNYAILSYVWGDSTVKPTKEIEDHPWWKKELATVWSNKNLNKAIEACKLLNIDYLWMDQLCINQNDIEEKRQEVRKMRGYYSNADVTLVAINTDAVSIKEKDEEKQFDSLTLLEKITDSQWFTRSWTYQEGWLSKHTIFMFDDKLIDGKAIAGIWSLDQPNYKISEKDRVFEGLLEGSLKVATPVGWVCHQEGYSPEDKVNLRLYEILRSTKSRGRAVAIDSIYSILGLLPYGSKIIPKYKGKLCKGCKKKENKQQKAVVCEHAENQKTEFPKYFKEELEDALLDVMKAAVEYGHGEPLSWHGKRNSWIPRIDIKSGSIEVEGGINIDCKEGSIDFVPDSNNVKMSCSEYPVFSSRDDDSYPIKSSDEEYTLVDSGLCKRRVTAEVKSNKKKIILRGTYEVLDSIKDGKSDRKNRCFLVVPNKGEWKNDKFFAVLAEKKDDVYHRIGLVELDKESAEVLQGAPEKKIIFGANLISQEESRIGEREAKQEQNYQQQFQSQIQQIESP